MTIWSQAKKTMEVADMPNEEKKNIFDDIEEKDTTIDSTETVETEEFAGEPDEQIQDVTVDDFSSVAPADRIKKVELNGMILPIKEVRFTRPKISDFRTGEKIEPKKAESGALYYRAKMVVVFDTTGTTIDTKNVAEYVPNVKYFVNNGIIAKIPRIPRNSENQLGALFQLYAKIVGKDINEISDKEFVTELTKFKVKIKTVKGTYKGRDWFRNDIVELVPA